MATEITMPRLSDTMESGTIARWRKAEGEQVSKGDVIAEIETDKSNMELEAYSNGVLGKILVKDGESAALGQPIALLAASEEEAQQLRSSSSGGQGTATETERPAEPAPAGGESAQNGVPEAQSPTGQQAPPAQPAQGVERPASETGERRTQSAEGNGRAPSPDGATSEAAEQGEREGRIKASPLARRMAREHEIDLARLAGTGPGGRITKDDVQAFLRQSPGGVSPTPAQPVTTVAAQNEQTPVGTGRAVQPVTMTRMQQTIARRMTEARFSAPDFVLTAEMDMTEARALLRSIVSVEGAPKVGPNDFLIKAVAVALARHPEVNAGWERDTVVRFGRINVGNAVAIEGGLVVPVIMDADRKTLGQIATESKALIEKAHAGKLAPADYEYGTFTISNLGMYGIDQFTAVINVPEACIMGVGAITPKPVVIDGEVVVRDRMRLTLSCDHRVINGAQGAEFLRTLRGLLEHPVMAVL